MVFWTLQSKFVVEQAKEEGVFHPDFSFSSQQHISDCTRILDAFNNLNRTECKGLIFCLAPEQFQNQTNEYRDLSNIKELFHNNTAVRNSLAVEPYSLFDNLKQQIQFRLTIGIISSSWTADLPMFFIFKKTILIFTIWIIGHLNNLF